MNHIVIMAGGRGLRLHPLTLKDPKPMLKIGDKPMIELLMERFAAQGFKNFTISVGYLADIIIDYFGDGRKWGWQVLSRTARKST